MFRGMFTVQVRLYLCECRVPGADKVSDQFLNHAWQWQVASTQLLLIRTSGSVNVSNSTCGWGKRRRSHETFLYGKVKFEMLKKDEGSHDHSKPKKMCDCSDKTWKGNHIKAVLIQIIVNQGWYIFYFRLRTIGPSTSTYMVLYRHHMKKLLLWVGAYQ